jgi:hypothetical protein
LSYGAAYTNIDDVPDCKQGELRDVDDIQRHKQHGIEGIGEHDKWVQRERN